MKAVRFAKGLEKLFVPIESIRPDPRNPNNGDVESVIESIQINGFNQVVTVDEKTGYIEAGHTRWAALCALESPVVPVVFAEHDEAGRTRYLIADNATGKKAVINESEEIQLLRQLQDESELWLAGTGYTEEEFERKVDRLAAALDDDVDVGHGFGDGDGLRHVFEVIVAFDDDTTRDNLFDELKLRFPGKVRWMNY